MDELERAGLRVTPTGGTACAAHGWGEVTLPKLRCLFAVLANPPVAQS